MNSTDTGAATQAVTRYAAAAIPTRRGDLQVVVYRDTRDGSEHVALIRGEIAGRDGVLTRVHSECITSEVFGSLKCDCREQLEASLDAIFDAGAGVVLYMRQEGRGIGLGNKIRAYALQAQGHDTVEANELLGFHDDLRDYSAAAAMLRDLGVERVRLLTNNPRKIKGIEAHGVTIVERVPVEVPPNAHNTGYLETKRDKSGHLLTLENLRRLAVGS